MNHSAVLAVVLGACAGSVAAQGSAGAYGVLDAGVVGERACNGCSARIDSGIASESRLGIHGAEFIHDSLSAVFTLEAGVLPDSGRSGRGGALFGRQAFVGLRGRGGTLTVGRHMNLEYVALTEVGDPFKGGMAGSASNLIGDSGRQLDNSVQYSSSEVRGVSAAAS
jgi:predicted porin